LNNISTQLGGSRKSTKEKRSADIFGLIDETDTFRDYRSPSELSDQARPYW